MNNENLSTVQKTRKILWDDGIGQQSPKRD